MCKQGGRVKLFCPTLAKRYERRVQTFKKIFPTSSDFVQSPTKC